MESLLGMYLLVFCGVLFGGAYFLARYMAWVYERPQASGWEAGWVRLLGANPNQSMDGWQYARAILVFSVWGVVWLVAVLRFQNLLPGNPDGLPAVPWDLAFNTAVSFVTNTNWQAYSGESTLSHFSQMVGLGTQNFLSAAVGMSVAVALARGFRNRLSSNLGNFWVDLVRGTVFILIPLSALLTGLLMGQGVVQNFNPTRTVSTLTGVEQKIPGGPAASQVAIKQLGTNGGGFFGVNSAHPFENPTPISNFLQTLAILLLPAAFPFLFGRMVGRRRQGKLIFGVMAVLFLASLAGIWASEQFSPSLSGVAPLEGKEFRFSLFEASLWTGATTVASNGSVNAMLDSFSPLAGALAMVNILLGEIIFGGVGSGLYGMVLFVVLTVFLCGLMVGRSPEFLGKRIESREVIYSGIGALLPGLSILLALAAMTVIALGYGGVSNPGPHGFTQMFYAATSAAGNNGSAFAGYGANNVFVNLLLALLMWVGRFGVIVPVLLLAQSVGEKKTLEVGAGTLPTDTVLFGALLIGVILLVGGLTFFPALMLGPILEHGALVRSIGF